MPRHTHPRGQQLPVIGQGLDHVNLGLLVSTVPVNYEVCKGQACGDIFCARPFVDCTNEHPPFAVFADD